MDLFTLLFSAANETSSDGKSMESLKKIFTSPIFYIILGSLVLLIFIMYLLRRFVKAKPNTTTIIVRRGNVNKVLDEKNPKAFLVPFRDSIGAIIGSGEKEFSSDKLFINNGPDALYKVNYTLKYRVLDPKEFYPFSDKLDKVLPAKLNDELRLFADQGNALVIVKDYRENEQKIVDLINKAVEEYYIEVLAFKVNLIEPLGRK